MASIKILKPPKETENEPVEYSMEIIEEEGESQQSAREKFEGLKKGLENSILCEHSEYGVSIHFSNPDERLILEAAYLYRKFALSIIREIAREQGLEVQEEETS